MLDLVSDLHIDQWDLTLSNMYPCGETKHFPFQWKEVDHSNILVVAGDISDNIDLSLQYLNEISKYYQKILFVDGNHEHVQSYPDLITEKKILEKVRNLGNSKLVYLPQQPYIEDGIAFIGACGWWDYFQKEIEKKDLEYFSSWRPDFTVENTKYFIHKVKTTGENQINRMLQLLHKFDVDPDIKQVVIVTHTVPPKNFSEGPTVVNSLYQKLFSVTRKLKYWFFGHTHQELELDDKKDGIKFITNPRGRAEDFDREVYQVKKISISKL